jgi:hypothetical protein
MEGKTNVKNPATHDSEYRGIRNKFNQIPKSSLRDDELQVPVAFTPRKSPHHITGQDTIRMFSRTAEVYEDGILHFMISCHKLLHVI